MCHAQKDPEADGKSKHRIFILQYTNSGSLCSLARKGIHRTGIKQKQNWNPVADLT